MMHMDDSWRIMHTSFWGKEKVLQLAGSLICIGFFISALLGNTF